MIAVTPPDRYLCVDADRGQAGDLQVQHDLVAYSGHPCAQGEQTRV